MNFKYASIITSIISIAAPLFMLRVYLGYFDNASLLTEDLANTSILSGVSIYISLSVVIFIILLFLPSIVFSIVVPKKDKYMWDYKSISENTGRSLLVNAFFSSVFFSLVSYISSVFNVSNLYYLTASVLVFISGVMLINYEILHYHINNIARTKSKEAQRKIRMQYFYVYPFFGIFLILLSSFGLLMILESVNRNKISNDFLDFIRVASVIIMLCVMNIIPGVIFLILHGRTSLTKAGYCALGSAIGALILMASVMTSIFPLIINRTMTFIGIADWKERQYIIDSTQFPEDTFVKEKWKFEKTTLKDSFIVHGVMVYSLNNTKLLCPAEIRSLYNDRIHFVPWSEHYDADVAKKLINYSASCQPFIKGGVRRLSEG